MPTATADTPTGAALRALIAHLVDEIGGPISALRAIQDERGWIDSDAVDAVADVFNLGRAEVRGLVEFYSDFRQTPPAEHTLALCQAEACQAAGSRELTSTVADRLGATLGERSADGRVSLEAVCCLGLCARAPAMMLDGELVVEADQAVERVLGDLLP